MSATLLSASCRTGLFLLLFSASFVLAQTATERVSLAKEAPAKPAERLKDAFPEANEVVWHQVVKGEEIQWESSFAHEQAVYNLRYDDSGTLLWSDKKTTWEAIPIAAQTAMQQALAEKLGKYSIILVEERVAARLQQYAITVTTKTAKGTQQHTAVFDRAGTLNRIEAGPVVPLRPKRKGR